MHLHMRHTLQSPQREREPPDSNWQLTVSEHRMLRRQTNSYRKRQAHTDASTYRRNTHCFEHCQPPPPPPPQLFTLTDTLTYSAELESSYCLFVHCLCPSTLITDPSSSAFTTGTCRNCCLHRHYYHQLLSSVCHRMCH